MFFVFCRAYPRDVDYLHLPIRDHGVAFLNREYSASQAKRKEIPSLGWRLYSHGYQARKNGSFLNLSVKDINESLVPSKMPPCTVRVLLARAKERGWTIESEKGFYRRLMPSKASKITKSSTLSIVCRSTELLCDNNRIHGDIIEFIPVSGYFGFDGKIYEGSCSVVRHQGEYFLINKVPLERYVQSVLYSESWPGWPLEVNKAFAIACRSYVVAKILEHRSRSKPFDIRDSNIHQTYRGVNSRASLKEAVEETERLILTYNERPIVAMFDACCGGLVPADIQGSNFVNFKSAPYLERKKVCTFCKPCKLYQWSVEMSLQEFEELFATQGIPARSLKDMSISKKDKAGIVHEVTLHTAKGTHVISGKKLYTWLKPFKSYCYTLKRRGKKIVVEGRGYGHHLGVCQWGAWNMVANHGFTHKQILSFYYPKTALVKICNIL